MTRLVLVVLHLLSVGAALVALPLAAALVVSAGLVMSIAHVVRRDASALAPGTAERGRILAPNLVVTERGIFATRHPEALRALRRGLRWPRGGGNV